MHSRVRVHCANLFAQDDGRGQAGTASKQPNIILKTSIDTNSARLDLAGRRPNLAPDQPRLAQDRLIWAEARPMLPQIARCRANLARTRSALPQQPNLARIRPSFGHLGRRNDCFLGTLLEQRIVFVLSGVPIELFLGCPARQDVLDKVVVFDRPGRRQPPPRSGGVPYSCFPYRLPRQGRQEKCQRGSAKCEPSSDNPRGGLARRRFEPPGQAGSPISQHRLRGLGTRETCFLGFVGFMTGCNELVFKRWAMEPRPDHSCNFSCGFPSGHSVMSCGFFMLMFLDAVFRTMPRVPLTLADARDQEKATAGRTTFFGWTIREIFVSNIRAGLGASRGRLGAACP